MTRHGLILYLIITHPSPFVTLKARFHPCWQCYLVPRLREGGSKLVVIIDHAIGDGTALIAAFLSVLDGEGPRASALPRSLPGAPRSRR